MSQKLFTVGIDIDNTLIDYSGVFYHVGRDLGWLPEVSDDANAALTDCSKNAVKSYLHGQQEFDRWTELQGIVYGKQLHKAKLYDNALLCVQWLLAQGVNVQIISHKTRYPYLGEKVDLHQSALSFLHEQQLIGDAPNQVPLSHVHFLEEKQTKVAQIAKAQCDVFIDDLLEIFALDGFPNRCKALWFAPSLFDENTGQINQQSSSVVQQLSQLASRGVQLQVKPNWTELQSWLAAYLPSEFTAHREPSE